MIPKTFKKSERLSKQKLIKELFSKGSSFYLYPFKVLVLPSIEEGINSHQLLVTVPKRNHKRAVVRNRLKRRIREAYRIHKQELHQDVNLLIAYIYTSKEVLDFHEIEKKVITSIIKLNNEVKR